VDRRLPDYFSPKLEVGIHATIHSIQQQTNAESRPQLPLGVRQRHSKPQKPL
jgi:hypothetical protein